MQVRCGKKREQQSHGCPTQGGCRGAITSCTYDVLDVVEKPGKDADGRLDAAEQVEHVLYRLVEGAATDTEKERREGFHRVALHVRRNAVIESCAALREEPLHNRLAQAKKLSG